MLVKRPVHVILMTWTGCILMISGSLAARESAITVRSLSVDEKSVDERSASAYEQRVDEKPFRAPVIDDSAPIERQYELQLLQQEVLELRGLVEELSHSVEQLKSRQADRYMELDRRLEDLRQGGTGAAVPDIDSPTDPVVTGTSRNPVASGSEKKIYDTALELIRNRQYDEAIAQLDKLIRDYPEGQYAPNAYYWLGEVHAAKPNPDYEKARQALAQVISFFPENRKVPDAGFKLGKVYHLMGDCARASDILKQVVQQNQGMTVARLAESYLRDKVGSCR